MDQLLAKHKMQLLHFIVQDAHICIELQYVNKILPLVLLEIVPNSPQYLAGLINLAGKPVPVIDLAMFLGMRNDKPYSLDTPILLCSYEAHQAGFIVDKVTELAEVDEDMIQMHEDFNAPASPFNGTVTTNEKMSLLINISRILPINVHHIKRSINKKNKGIEK